MSDLLRNKRVFIYGYGMEGRAALRYFAARVEAEDLFVILAERDEKPKELVQTMTEAEGIEYFEQEKDPDHIIFLRSPGLSLDRPLLKTVLAKNIVTRAPIDYWLEHEAPEKTITVTGSKGKSTTTSLIVHCLKKAGLKAKAYGNIGVFPLGQTVEPDEVAVVELSSYQLSDAQTAAPYHLITNLYKEHTTWHGSEVLYQESKLRPFTLNNDCQAIVPRTLENSIPVQNKKHWVDDIAVPKEIAEPLRSNCQAALVAVQATGWAGITIDWDDFLKEWSGLPHRQDIISETAGRFWVDDSLATIPEACLLAVERFRDKTVHLLLGGEDRQQDFSQFIQDIKQYPRLSIYPFAASGNRYADESGQTGVYEGLEQAVQAAFDESQAGDVILFSPAAPSSPPFVSFEERSAFFKNFADSVKK